MEDAGLNGGSDEIAFEPSGEVAFEPSDEIAFEPSDEIAFEAYGVRLAVGAGTPEILDRIQPLLPPGWRPCPRAAVEARFWIVGDDRGKYSLFRNRKELAVTRGLELELALLLLDTQLRIHLGRTAPDTIFIHAGAVAHNGRMIVIPARSFGGKTTLVAALVKVGAVYYSDEFAVIGRDGIVHHYAKPLSVREGDGLAQTDHAVESFGGVTGDEPLPLGMIVVTTYTRGAEWNPKRLSPGAGALALLANAVPAKERPGDVLPAISRAAEGALVLEGDRGEAEAVAPLLLAELERHAG
jgi:hypothetical protein